MSGSHRELHIDVPVKLDEVRRDGVRRVELDDFTSVPAARRRRINPTRVTQSGHTPAKLLQCSRPLPGVLSF
jgi:hypothetical protein